MRASERDEEARRVWREEMKEVDANQLVIVDETGSNIGLTPLYAWARHLVSELSAASRVITAKIPLCWLLFPSMAWEQR